MTPAEFAIEQRKFVAEQFDQSRRYVHIVLVAGYAGLFALWTSLGDYLSALAKLSSALLTCLSIMVFLAWEIYSMIRRHEAIALTRMMIDEPKNFERSFNRIQDRLRAILLQTEKSWRYVVTAAATAGALAYMIILSSFTASLFSELWPRINMQDSLFVIDTLWVAFGIALGALFVIFFVRIDAWWTRRTNRKNFADALNSELEAFQALVHELAQKWQSDGVINGETLQEIAYSRRIFDDNRGALHILEGPELQSAVNDFYRSSFGMLSKLQLDWNYHLSLIRDPNGAQEESVAELRRTEGEISDRIARLSDLRAQAAALSQRLQALA